MILSNLELNVVNLVVRCKCTDGKYRYTENNSEIGCRKIHKIIGDEGDNWFILYVNDCYDPPLTLVRADSFEDAYELYCDDDHSLVIDEEDLDDYNLEELQYNSDGDPIDTECVGGFEVELISLHCE